MMLTMPSQAIVSQLNAEYFEDTQKKDLQGAPINFRIVQAPVNTKYLRRNKKLLVKRESQTIPPVAYDY